MSAESLNVKKKETPFAIVQRIQPNDHVEFSGIVISNSLVTIWSHCEEGLLVETFHSCHRFM